ncbi:MAG: PIN domain-containing protein [Thermoanaerobaculia bacterium]
MTPSGGDVIALDTSALLRYLIGDDPGLADRVARIIEGDEPVGISTPVLVEVVHTLRGLPGPLPNPQVADTLIELLAHNNVVLTDLSGDLAAAAIAGVRHLSPTHIVDALICAGARQAGATRLLTNDSKFASRLVPVIQLDELSDEDGAPPSPERKSNE